MNSRPSQAPSSKIQPYFINLLYLFVLLFSSSELGEGRRKWFSRKPPSVLWLTSSSRGCPRWRSPTAKIGANGSSCRRAWKNCKKCDSQGRSLRFHRSKKARLRRCSLAELLPAKAIGGVRDSQRAPAASAWFHSWRTSSLVRERSRHAAWKPRNSCCIRQLTNG